MMTQIELEQRISEIRSKPLMVVCQTRTGSTSVMSVQDCVKTGSQFIHIAADALDALLDQALSEDTLL